MPTVRSSCGMTEPARCKHITQWGIFDVIVICLIWWPHHSYPSWVAWSGLLNTPHNVIPCILYMCCCFQFSESLFHAGWSYDPFHKHVGLLWSFQEGYFWNYICGHGAATFTVNAADTLCHLLQVSFQPGFHERTLMIVFSSEDHLNVIPIPYVYELLRITLNIWDTHRTQRLYLYAQLTAALWVNNQSVKPHW